MQSIAMADMSLNDRLKEFIEHEIRSWLMDIGGITPLYVLRHWGGKVSLEEY